MAEMEDDFESEEMEDEDSPSFGEGLYHQIAAPIKQFLTNYFGDRLNDAPAQTFRDIEDQLKTDIILYATMIPEHLYHYRSITDYDEWDKACDAFVWDKNAVYPWPVLEKWYNLPDNEEDEPMDEDEYEDLPADAKRVIDAADKLLDHHANFKGFMQPCCEVIIKETQKNLAISAAFDLSILSAEGYIALQQTINMLAEVVAENLHAITSEL